MFRQIDMRQAAIERNEKSRHLPAILATRSASGSSPSERWTAKYRMGGIRGVVRMTLKRPLRTSGWKYGSVRNVPPSPAAASAAGTLIA
jgi:hypothetical protein